MNYLGHELVIRKRKRPSKWLTDMNTHKRLTAGPCQTFEWRRTDGWGNVTVIASGVVMGMDRDHCTQEAKALLDEILAERNGG